MIDIPTRLRRGASPEITINRFRGEDLSTVATQIADNRASLMENCMLDQQGMLQQIPGYRKAITGTVSAGTTPVRMLTRNETAGKFVKSHGGKLYTFSPGGPETELYGPVTDAKMKDFVMGAYQYFINGAEFIRWNGSGAMEQVEASAFVPTTVVGRLPAGGGTVLEAVNLLQPKRKNSFRGDGTATVYQLDTTNLDGMTVTAVVAGVSMTEGSGFTVNRATGQVTFTTAPADGLGVDNVVITFAKTVTGYADRIKKCRFFAIFGVGNNLRVFLSGNPDYPNQDWYSAMQDPTYFPDLNYTKIGSEGVAIKGYALLQGAMHVLKDASTYDPTIWTRSIATNTDGTIYFPVRPNNSSVGMIATDSVKSINDICYMLTKQGIYKITSTYVSDERGLDHISGWFDPKLLIEADLENAVAFDFNGRYGIAINENIYVVDYNNGEECYRWVGIQASCFCEYNRNLYIGDSKSGNVFIENKLGDVNNTNLLDDRAIESKWYSAMFAMDRANYYKMIDNIAVTLVPLSTRSNVDIYIRTNRKNEKLVKSITLTRFDIEDVDLDDFSLLVSELPQTENREVNLSDIIYFQIILKNSTAGKGFAISNITIPYSFAGEI